MKKLQSLLKNHTENDENTIDKNLYNLLKPMNCMQIVTCSYICVVKNNRILTNGVLANFLTVLSATSFIAINGLKLNTALISSTKPWYYIVFDALHYFDFIYYSSGFILNTFLRIRNSKLHVKLLLNINSIFKIISCKKFKSINRSYKFFCFLIAMYAIVLIYFINYYAQSFTVTNVIYDILFLVFDFNIIYAIVFMKIMRVSVRGWTEELVKVCDIHDVTTRRLKLKVMFDGYLKLMETFKLYKKCFEVMILYHLLETTAHGLLYIKFAINLAVLYPTQAIAPFLNLFVLLSAWLFKNILLQTALGVESELFYITVEEIEFTCVAFLKNTERADARRFSKRVLKLHTSFLKFSLRGLFLLDATLPLKLIRFLTMTTIVLTQFMLM